MIDLNSKSSGVTGRVNWHLDQALAGQAASEPRRAYLGASMIGGDCERAVQYEFMGQPRDVERAPSSQLVFDRGHWAENYLAGLFIRAGFVLSVAGPDGGQHGFSILDGIFQGHADGLLLWLSGGHEPPIPLPALWECKCLGSKGAKALAKDRCQGAYPKYYRQVQVLMGEMGLERCLFTALCADTMELRHELIAYDAATHRAMVDRAQRILAAVSHAEIVPRGFLAEDWQCKCCPWIKTCRGAA